MDTQITRKPPKLRKIAIERLKAAEWNPRSVTTESIGRLTLSLAEFGNLQCGATQRTHWIVFHKGAGAPAAGEDNDRISDGVNVK